MVELQPITQENFIEAFNLKLAPGQEEWVSHPIRSLAQAYVYREQCQPFGIYADGRRLLRELRARRRGQSRGDYGVSVYAECRRFEV